MGLVVVHTLYSGDEGFSVGCWAEGGIIRHFDFPCSPNLGKADGGWGTSCELGSMVSVWTLTMHQVPDVGKRDRKWWLPGSWRACCAP